jgi:glycosyltransferase involved in cell wall biosynthesis
MTPSILITVLAHNEAALIADCLASLPLGEPGIEVHVVVNGSTDATAERARVAARGRATIHDYPQGGKARSWNRFLFDDDHPVADVHFFVDGDTVVAPGAIAAMLDVFNGDPGVNAVGAVPLNGRNAASNQATSTRDRGLFGALYAIRGAFLWRMKATGIRLPEDLIGDDGLIGALAKTDLGPESRWSDDRVVTVADAGFYMSDPVRLIDPASWRMQYRRMINYSERHFQNRIISAIMRDVGPKGLPRAMADLYPEWLPTFMPRPSLRWWWFDRLALRRMSAAARQDRGYRGPAGARSGEA